jgi:hypothetical protein
MITPMLKNQVSVAVKVTFFVYWISCLRLREMFLFTHQARRTSGTLRSGETVILQGYCGCDVKCKILDHIPRENALLSIVIK